MKQLINNVMSFVKKFFKIPEKNKQGLKVLEVDTMCCACIWEGNFTQTVLDKNYEEACPRCGSKELIYIND